MKVLQLTGMCHMNCLYCMDEYKNVKHLDVDKIINMIPKIEDKNVLVTGGEPLLVDRINDIIDVLYQNNKVITLHTEGSLIKKLSVETLKKIKTISLPLDSCVKEENKLLGRNFNQFDICMKTIDYVSEYCNVRISSVLTNINKYGIIELANILKNMDLEWRVYELNYAGNAKDNSDILKIDYDEHSDIFNDLEVTHNKVKIMNISKNYGDYFYINPRLEKMHYFNNKYSFVKSY